MTWFFHLQDKTQNKLKLIATVAKVLNPNSDPRCSDAKNNPDLICVIIENDGDQCSGLKDISAGYLTYYQGGKKFYNFAIWSHGADKCQTAKHQVAFFTRMNPENIRKQIYYRISLGTFCSDKPTQMFGFRNALDG